MATEQQIIIDGALPVAEAAIEEWGLEANTALLWGLTTSLMRRYLGQDPPRIISGYRSPRRTRELLDRWERGLPGVAFKPARRSWHHVGRAIDLERRDPTVDYLWTLFGGRAGYTFGDDNHYDLPGPDQPPAAY